MSQSFEQDGRSKDSDRGEIEKAASAIIGALSKRHNSTVMLAVVEVKVVKHGESPPIGESRVPDVGGQVWFLPGRSNISSIKEFYVFVCRN